MAQDKNALTQAFSSLFPRAKFCSYFERQTSRHETFYASKPEYLYCNLGWQFHVPIHKNNYNKAIELIVPLCESFDIPLFRVRNHKNITTQDFEISFFYLEEACFKNQGIEIFVNLTNLPTSKVWAQFLRKVEETLLENKIHPSRRPAGCERYQGFNLIFYQNISPLYRGKYGLMNPAVESSRIDDASYLSVSDLLDSPTDPDDEGLSFFMRHQLAIERQVVQLAALPPRAAYNAYGYEDPFRRDQDPFSQNEQFLSEKASIYQNEYIDKTLDVIYQVTKKFDTHVTLSRLRSAHDADPAYDLFYDLHDELDPNMFLEKLSDYLTKDQSLQTKNAFATQLVESIADTFNFDKTVLRFIFTINKNKLTLSVLNDLQGRILLAQPSPIRTDDLSCQVSAQ